MHLTTTLLVALSGLIHLTAASGGFTSNCIEHYLYTDCAHLVARCPDNQGQIRSSKLDLNQCFKNNNGRLEPADHGDAFGYRCEPKGTGPGCEECSVENGKIKCWCKRKDGQVQLTVGDLNAVVSNNNGFLECYGHPSIYV
ncbi:CVNH domain-containing protein [Aspergillus undulatus]|uniref:CVNH domain-containing protein n=1 Tax=Aspergillus undulatus TaxID=1810928 RepID=UPI003CCCB20A